MFSILQGLDKPDIFTDSLESIQHSIELLQRGEALERVREQHAALTERQTELTQMIEEKSHQLTGLGVEAAAVQNHPHLQKVYEARQEEIKDMAEEIDQLRAEFAENGAMLEAFDLHAERVFVSRKMGALH